MFKKILNDSFTFNRNFNSKKANVKTPKTQSSCIKAIQLLQRFTKINSKHMFA